MCIVMSSFSSLILLFGSFLSFFGLWFSWQPAWNMQERAARISISNKVRSDNWHEIVLWPSCVCCGTCMFALTHLRVRVHTHVTHMHTNRNSRNSSKRNQEGKCNREMKCAIVSGLSEIGVWWRQKLLSFTPSRLALSRTHQGPGIPRAVFPFGASLCIPMATDSFVICTAGRFSHLLGLPHFGVAYVLVRRQLPSVFGVRQAPTVLRSVQVDKTHPISFEDPAGVMNASEAKYFAAASVPMAVHRMPSRWC